MGKRVGTVYKWVNNSSCSSACFQHFHEIKVPKNITCRKKTSMEIIETDGDTSET